MRVDDIGSGPAILAVHGLGGGAYYFHGLARRLAPDYRVLAVDLPTASRPDYSMESWIDDLGALIDERVGEPVVILGHSLGTIVALRAWATWPERVRGLIFVGGIPAVLPRIHVRLSQRLITLEQATDFAGWGAKISPGVFSPAAFRDCPETVALYERLLDAHDVNAYVRCCRILISSDATGVVPTVYVPYVAITGEHDQYAPPDAVAAFIAQIPQPPRLEVLPHCGHVPFLERPDAFAAIVRAFMPTC